ncbi:MAG: nitroreductase family protein [Candidatus Aenigmatarchaeota archaeon]
MELFEALVKRRSIRKFEEEDVDDEEIGELLTACKWAPSAGNRQPWKIVVVKEEDKIEELARAALDQNWITQAPVVLVVMIDKDRGEATYGERGRELYALQSTAAAVQNMLLRATDIGLGACWIGAFDEANVRDIVGCQKEDIKPVALIPVGHPREEPEPPGRKDITSFAFLNEYGEKEEGQWKGIDEYAKKAKRKARELLDSLRRY